MPATDSFFRNLKTMHVVFVVSAVILLVSTLTMMVKDHDDEWRDTQTRHYQINALMLKQDEADAEAASYDVKLEINGEEKELQFSSYSKAVEYLETQLETANADLKENAEQIEDLKKEQKELKKNVAKQDQKVKFTRAERDVARANYDLAIRDVINETDPEKFAGLKEAFDDKQAEVEELEKELQELETDLKAVNTELAEITNERDELQAALKKVQSNVSRLHDTRMKIAPENWFARAKREIMTWPIIDGFNSHLKIQQDWLPDLKIQLGMMRTMRYDRCRTCHLGIDQTKPGNVPKYPFGKPKTDDLEEWVKKNEFPHPHATHPRPDLYCTASSPHPTTKFGCTICHDGQGSGTSFTNASHGPNDPYMAKKWKQEYKWFNNHFWEYPMHPERFEESGCIKCHHQVTELGQNPKWGPTAPKVVKGQELVQKFGCFGCHEIQGYESDKPIGPDLRLEPVTNAEAVFAARKSLGILPEETPDADQQIQITKLAAQISDNSSPTIGKERRVGPALTHIGSKTTADWIAYWTELPKRFRPGTRMPQFFHLSNQEDEVAAEFLPVELAGIGHYLASASRPFETDHWADGYEPDAERGKKLFAERGCVSCHTHDDPLFKGAKDDFGPNLTRVHEKMQSEEQGRQWIYTWIRNPTKYNPRTRMPNLYLEPYTVKEGSGDDAKEVTIDPAADIAAFLAQGGPSQYRVNRVTDEALDKLVETYLSKSLTKAQIAKWQETRDYPVDRDKIKGDEIALTLPGDAVPTSEEVRELKLNYVGRRTISRYGCYACHAIPGYEDARPIGTSLQDWGRKDTTKLALEHIEEFLHHHGEEGHGEEGHDAGDHSSTHKRAERALKMAASGEFENDEDREREMSVAFYYDSLMHHGRPGFIWQKLRAPRSYDYKKVETKGYDERLRMPKFTFSEDPDEQAAAIEAIATFVLGLVADPPAPEYIYTPSRREATRIRGEQLLKKYNCTSCHMVELPKIEVAVDLKRLTGSRQTMEEMLAEAAKGEGGFHLEALQMLNEFKPPFDGKTGRKKEFVAEAGFPEEGEPDVMAEGDVIQFHGLFDRERKLGTREPERLLTYTLWDVLELDKKIILPNTPITVNATQLVSQDEGRGGTFAEWLTNHLVSTGQASNTPGARQMAPPLLTLEGRKVQTPWLYEFLREPGRLREVTVLRMPRFNMSAQEAQDLANYFAAAEEQPFPYQKIPELDPEYLEQRQAQMNLANQILEATPLAGPNTYSDDDYLMQGWKVLNGEGLCIKCHAVAGNPIVGAGPTDIKGPNLMHVNERLRPEWLKLWLYRPEWITPYTSMLGAFKPGTALQYPNLYYGNQSAQLTGLRDALMNYEKLMESHPKYVYKPGGNPDENANNQGNQNQPGEESNE